MNLKLTLLDTLTIAAATFILGYLVGEKMVFVDFAQAAERIATEGD